MFSPLVVVMAGIRVYQRTLSPDHSVLRFLFPGGVCRFSPTCSEYMIMALSQHGWRGFRLGFRQLLACHPYSTHV